MQHVFPDLLIICNAADQDQHANNSRAALHASIAMYSAIICGSNSKGLSLTQQMLKAY
jgi:hypothetical protein